MNKKSQLILNTLILLLLLLLTAAAYKLWDCQRGVYKLTMPGTYVLDLKEGFYSVWYFWQWPTKGIFQKPQEIDLECIDENEKPIEKAVPKEFAVVHALQNTGRHQFGFDLQKAHSVRIRSSKKCVIVVSHSSSMLYQPEFGIFSFYGSFDDFNFCKPSSNN